jgi:hypothetical protein
MSDAEEKLSLGDVPAYAAERPLCVFVRTMIAYRN